MGSTAGHWLESPITGLVVTILLAIGTTTVAWWGVRPKRLIIIDIPRIGTPFHEVEAHSLPDPIADQSASDPELLYIVEVSLRTKGRWDVASDAFDHNFPLILDVGTKIQSVKTAQPARTPHLKVEATGNELRIGPGLVRRRRVWVFTLLTNGISTRFTYVNPLIDVDIRTRAEQRRRRQIFLSMTVPLYLFLAWALYSLGILDKIAIGLNAFLSSL